MLYSFYTCTLVRLLKELMNLTQSFWTLQCMSYLNSVYEVIRNRLCFVLMFDLSFEDFEVYRSLRFTEVRLEYTITDLSSIILSLCLCIVNNTSCFHLILEYWVHVAEELEDVLPIDRFSGCKITTNCVLAVWNQEHLDVLTNM